MLRVSYVSILDIKKHHKEIIRDYTFDTFDTFDTLDNLDSNHATQLFQVEMELKGQKRSNKQ